MAKYCFKVYLYDGTNKKIVPSMLDDNHTELSDIDRFVYKCGTSFELRNLLAQELGIKTEEIEKIKILQNRTENEFGIIINNPLLTPVLSSIEKKRIIGYQDYEMDAMVVARDNSTYLDMKEYLFENLESDFNFFLTEVYKYNNEFSKLLNRYGSSYNQKIYSETEARNLQNLKNKISLGLAIYKNYRGLCKACYDYNNRNFYQKKSAPIKKEEIPYRSPEYKEKEITQEDINLLNQYTNYLGEEKEEFLDIEEREQEYGRRR